MPDHVVQFIFDQGRVGIRGKGIGERLFGAVGLEFLEERIGDELIASAFRQFVRLRLRRQEGGRGRRLRFG